MLALLLWSWGLFDIWELASWRWRVELLARPVASTDKIKLILLDQNSLAWGERENGWSWPWPREVYGSIIDFCARNGAKVIIFDLLFGEPSFYGVEDDRALSDAIDRSPTFVAPLHLGKESGKSANWPHNVDDSLAVPIGHLEEWMSRGSREGLVMNKASFPTGDLMTRSLVLGGVTQEPDIDGIFRRCRLFHIFDDRAVPSLSLAAYLAAIPNARTTMAIRDGCLSVSDRCVPIDDTGKTVVRFRGPVATYETFSAAAVIQSELRIRAGEQPVINRKDVFRDCYVLFGTSAAGLLDLRPTPISRIYPGVELHATILDNLLSGDFIADLSPWVSVLTALALTLVSSALITLWRKVWQSVLICGALLPVPVLVGILAYRMNAWWPVVVHEVGMVLSMTGAVFLNYRHEGRQKAFIKKAFRHYLSPTVIEKLIEDPSRLDLGGERRELSMLFSDLRGFTSIAERLDPQSLTGLLNDYLTRMTDIVFEEGGTLDKYAGDSFIAFWNAPLDQPDHAVRACRAAIRCQMRLEDLRLEYERSTGTSLLARTGINTGPVVVGNMGSRERFDYTMLGDAANLASRLEKANKVFGTRILVSEATWNGTGGRFLGREVGILRVSGRQAPVRTYELIGFKKEDGTETDLSLFREGLRLYYSRRWTEAIEIFGNLPSDPVARVYTKRCRSLLNDPGIPWDGVWTLRESSG